MQVIFTFSLMKSISSRVFFHYRIVRKTTKSEFAYLLKIDKPLSNVADNLYLPARRE